MDLLDFLLLVFVIGVLCVGIGYYIFIVLRSRGE
ncbi:Uncharacterised protein [Helicobacter mustelae]|nr:Uncharacterised protein [Helicobacter mustelae]STP11944.1 Uncharacterised protein [Helicobacter mustelae]